MSERRPRRRQSEEQSPTRSPLLERLLALRATLQLLAMTWLMSVFFATADEFGWLPHASTFIALFLSLTLPAAATMAVLALRRQRGARQEEDSEQVLDPLTSLPMRRYFIRRLQDEIRRSHRLGRALTLVVLDVSNMEAVNREYGREAGDEVLRLVARSLQKSKRYTDLSARLGDDEFALLLADCEESGARRLVDRLEERLAREPATVIARRRPVTVWAGICAGIAGLEPEMLEQEEFLAAALTALSRAREERDKRRHAWSA